MDLVRIFCALAAAGACLTTVSLATADPAPVKHNIVSYSLHSGTMANTATSDRVVYSEVIDGGDVPWIRLGFGQVRLASGSRVQITSLLDGATQTLDAKAIAQWQYTSAYFNGAVVRLSLIAAGNSRDNEVEVDRLIVGEWMNGTESQCGPTDDRVPSSEPARGRLLDIGCTASIYNAQSCFITAGHCLSSPSFVDVVEFNVPPSQPNGNIVHPGPQDQYAATDDRQFIDGGIGNDWGLFKVFPNTQTGLMPFEAQGASMTLGTELPAVGTQLRIVGYGVDDGAANQTQQENSGPLTAIAGTSLKYKIDTEGGNSGSAVTRASDDVVVGIHTHAGCTVGGSGANQGTAITLPSLQSALQTFCPEDAGITCADISRMAGRCSNTGKTQAIIRMTDASHLGETLGVTIDGHPLNARIDFVGGLFAIAQANFGTGTHTVSLVDPANCPAIPDVQVTCP
jgi:V8-like Glu-specific endopeptidase